MSLYGFDPSTVDMTDPLAAQQALSATQGPGAPPQPPDASGGQGGGPAGLLDLMQLLATHPAVTGAVSHIRKPERNRIGAPQPSVHGAPLDLRGGIASPQPLVPSAQVNEVPQVQGYEHPALYALAQNVANTLRGLPAINPRESGGSQFAEGLIRSLASSFAQDQIKSGQATDEFNANQREQAIARNKMNLELTLKQQDEKKALDLQKLKGDEKVAPSSVTQAMVDAGEYPKYALGMSVESASRLPSVAKRVSADRRVNPGNDDIAQSIADAIVSGNQPPDVKGLYRYGAPVRAALADRGYDMTNANLDWQATQKHFATLNGAQQTRLRQTAQTAYDSLDMIEQLSDDLRKSVPTGQFKALNKASLLAARNGLYGKRAASVAQRLEAQIGDVASELGNVYMGGNSPTDHALALAQKNLSGDWDEKTLKDAIAQSRANLHIRLNSIQNTGAITPTGTSGAGRASDDPFSGFEGKVVRQ